VLVSCAAYEDGNSLGDIPLERIPEYLDRAKSFVWVSLHDASDAELAQMQRVFALHPLAVEDAFGGHERPKIVEYGDSMFAVLLLIEPGGGDYQVGELAIFAGPNYVVTVRNRAQLDFAAVRARCERETTLLRHGPGFILYALTDAVVDCYFPILDSLEDEVDSIEHRIFAPKGVPRDNIEALYAAKQRLMTMKHAVAPLLEGVSNLSGGRIPPLCAGLTEYFRDVYDHLQRLNQTTETIRESIATAMSVNLSMVTLQESETMKRLAGYAALLAVPTMIAGIYGMNFEHMPELKWHYGYALSLIAMASIDAYLYVLFKRAKWL
jgi:magnesium transporter